MVCQIPKCGIIEHKQDYFALKRKTTEPHFFSCPVIPLPCSCVTVSWGTWHFPRQDEKLYFITSYFVIAILGSSFLNVLRKDYICWSLSLPEILGIPKNWYDLAKCSLDWLTWVWVAFYILSFWKIFSLWLYYHIIGQQKKKIFHNFTWKLHVF